MKRIALVTLAIALVYATVAFAVTRRFTLLNDDVAAGLIKIDSVRTLTKSSTVTSTFGVPPGALALVFRAEGTITSGVDSGLVLFFRDGHYGRWVKPFTPTDSLAAVMGAGVDTNSTGTRFSIYYPLNPTMLSDSVKAYVKLLDDSDADSAESVLTWIEYIVD